MLFAEVRKQGLASSNICEKQTLVPVPSEKPDASPGPE